MHSHAVLEILLRNFHKIRPSRNEDVLYFVPEDDDRQSYLNKVPVKELEVAMDVCCEEPEGDVSDSFSELARTLMNENAIRMPAN